MYQYSPAPATPPGAYPGSAATSATPACPVTSPTPPAAPNPPTDSARPPVGTGPTFVGPAQHAPKPTPEDWRAAEREILDRLDLVAAYRALGFRPTGSGPSATGWLPGRAIGREDASPSAAIGVDGAVKGRYRDLGGDGDSLNLWECAAKHGGFADWRAARRYYADQVGVVLPTAKESATAERPCPVCGGQGEARCYWRPGDGLHLCAGRRQGDKVDGWVCTGPSRYDAHLWLWRRRDQAGRRGKSPADPTPAAPSVPGPVPWPKTSWWQYLPPEAEQQAFLASPHLAELLQRHHLDPGLRAAAEQALARERAFVAAAVKAMAAEQDAAWEAEQRERQALLAALHTPGYHVVPGRGPHLIAAAARLLADPDAPRRSLTVVASHADADAAELAIGEAGQYDVHGYPRLSEETCKRWHDAPDGTPGVAAAVKAGVPASIAFCGTCPHSKKVEDYCGYTWHRELADASRHLVVTARRASLNPTAWTGTREVALMAGVHPYDVTRPTREAGLAGPKDRATESGWASESLRLLHRAAGECRWAEEAIEVGKSNADFWARVQDLTRVADTMTQQGAMGVIDLPATAEEVNASEWASMLWQSIAPWPTRPAGEVTTLIMAAAGGQLQHLSIVPAELLPPGRQRRGHPQSVLGGVWEERAFPPGTAVLALGAYHELDGIIGSEWQPVDLPATAVAPPDTVTQVLRRVTARSSPRQMAAVLRLFLERHPGTIGVVGPRLLVKRVQKALASPRLVTAGWFSGAARRLGKCSLVVGLGVPRPHPALIMRRLLQSDDPAARVGETGPLGGRGGRWQAGGGGRPRVREPAVAGSQRAAHAAGAGRRTRGVDLPGHHPGRRAPGCAAGRAAAWLERETPAGAGRFAGGGRRGPPGPEGGGRGCRARGGVRGHGRTGPDIGVLGATGPQVVGRAGRKGAGRPAQPAGRLGGGGRSRRGGPGRPARRGQEHSGCPAAPRWGYVR